MDTRIWAGTTELPVLGQPAPERADAARNRAKIVAAAETLVADRGVHSLTMNEVAAAAGVGVGTVYRRFGTLTGLINDMMTARENQLQRAMMAGDPPIGPGAPAPERARAFLHTYAELLETYGELLAAAENNTPRLRYSGAYALHHTHLRILIGQASPDADADYLAAALLAPLAPGHFLHQRHRQGMSLDRIKGGLDVLLTGILGG